jgi:DNA-binding LacI/PurR family transcriptional regulator
MQQIAEAAGVSRMAVSLALRNSPKISKATTERIRRIAEEFGYRPNPMVSALMTQLRHGREVRKPSVLAYVTAYPTEDGWRQPGPFVAFYEGAKRRAETLGYVLDLWWLRRPGLSEQRFCDILFTRDIHGLIFAPLPGAGGALNLDWSRFASSAIAYSVTSPAMNRASNDQFGTITLALAELTRLGYRRIGLAITRESDERVRQKWSAGMLVYQQGIPPAARVPILRATTPLHAAFASWFREHRPDAVLSVTERCVNFLDEIGVRVPEDVGFADLALTGADADFAGVNQNSELVGAAAVDLVDAQLRRNERGIPAHAKTVLVPGVWVPGPTVRQVNAAERSVGSPA